MDSQMFERDKLAKPIPRVSIDYGGFGRTLYLPHSVLLPFSGKADEFFRAFFSVEFVDNILWESLV